MADDTTNQGNNNEGTDNPVQQFGTPSSEFQQSGVGTPQTPDLQNLVDQVSDISKMMLQFAQDLNKVTQPAMGLTKEFDKWKTQLKFAVEATDDVEESVKEVLAINKKFSQTGLMGMNKKSYNDVKAYLKELQDSQKKLQQNRAFLSKQGQDDLKRAIEHTNDALETLEDNMKKVGDANQEIDPDVLLMVAKNARRATEETGKLATNLGRGGKISRGLQDLSKIVGLNIFDKFTKVGGIAKDLGKWKAQVKAEGARDMKAQAKAFAQKYNIRNAKGELETDLGALRRARPAGAGPVSGRGGIAGFADSVVERIASGAGKGGLRGVFGRMAGGVLEAGGGEAGTGLGVRALMGGASIGEGAAGAIGAAAVPLALLEGLRRLVDAVGEENKELAQKFGGGGLFTGEGGTAQDRLQSMREFLAGGPGRGGGAFSSLGVRKEEQLKLVQAIEDLGVALPELARTQQFTGQGIVKGIGVGGIQEQAYTQGRQLGLDVGTAAQTNIKYILQYKQSQEAVNKLFSQFIKDTKASGITTTKYLSIIDEIESQFDKMGKSLQTVTGIMSVLGRTGVETSDDLKDSLNLLLGPQQRGLEQQAFILQQTSQATRGQLETGQVANVGAARTTAGEALTKIGLDNKALNTISDVEVAIQRVRLDERKDAQGNKIADSVRGKETVGALEALLREMQLLNHTRRFAAGTENAVNYAAAVQQYGTATSRMTTNFAAILGQLSHAGTNLSQLLSGNVKNQALLNQLAQVYGNAPDWQQKIQDTLSAIGGATTKALQTKPEEINDSDIKDIYRTAAADPVLQNKLAKAETPEDMRKALSDLAKSPEDAAQLSQDLETNESLLMKLVTGNSSIVKAVQDSVAATSPSAENIAAVTTSTGEKIEDALARGFVLLARALTFIADFLQKHFGGNDAGPGITDYLGALDPTGFGAANLAGKIAAGKAVDEANKKAAAAGSPTPGAVAGAAATATGGSAIDALRAATPQFAAPGTNIKIEQNNVEKTQGITVKEQPANRAGETSTGTTH